MAKARGSTEKVVGGPYLDAAFICEEVLREKDGTYSAIRMVNRITFHEQTFNPGTIILTPLTLVVSFKAGDAKDTRHLSLYVTNPSRERTPFERFAFPHAIDFTNEDTGAFIALRNFPIKYQTDGTYWIDVLLGRKLYSRLPLTIRTSPP
jgi:hypothetical protein